MRRFTSTSFAASGETISTSALGGPANSLRGSLPARIFFSSADSLTPLASGNTSAWCRTSPSLVTRSVCLPALSLDGIAKR